MGLFNRNKGRTSFLERNQYIIGGISATLVLAGSAFALVLSGGILANTYSVTAHFTDAAGLKAGDKVKVAGLEAGTVGSIEISRGEVVVELKVNSDVKMPEDSDAEIVIETLLGKKNVTLFAGTSERIFEDGDEIPSDRTRTPVTLIDLADTSVPLLEESDADAFEQFMEEITAITEGKREQVTSLVENFGDVAAAIDLRREELKRLIDSLRIVAGTFAERDQTLVNLIDNFDVVLGNLSERTADIEELLHATEAASNETADLVTRKRKVLDSLLANLAKTLKVVDNHQVDLAASITYLEASVKGYQSVGYSQGTKNRWANIFVQSLGPLGTDAFLGPCGTFDQALDTLLGPDPRPCDEREQNPQGSDDPPDGPVDTKEAPDPTDVLDDIGLPGDLGDILDSVTGSTGLGSALRAGLL